MQLLGLDYGGKRIGYAIGETSLGIAFGREIIENKSIGYVLEKLKKIIKEDQVEKIVVGLPKFLDGSESEQTLLTQEFGTKIKEELGIEVDYFDERLSSTEATKNLHLLNIKEKHQKGKKDVIAAEIILQKYMESI